MSYFTQEYTVLASLNGGRDVVIKPNTPFEAFSGEYVVTAYALIRDEKTKDLVVALSPGQKVKGVGETESKAERLQDLSIKEIKQMLVTEGLSFPSKAKKSELIAILEG